MFYFIVHILSLLLSSLTPPDSNNWDWNKIISNDDVEQDQNKSTVSLRSSGKTIELDIDVVDPSINTGSDPVRSDHVELWLSLDDAEILDPVDFITNKKGQLFRVNGKAIPSDLEKELNKTTIDRINNSECPDSCSENCNDPEFTSRLNKLRNEMKVPPYRRINVFFGLVHIGLFPDGRPAVLYDREAYNKIKPDLDLDMVQNSISYETKVSNAGYHISATIKPDALLFASKEGIKSIRARVDQIDVADNDKKVTLLSTSKNPKWGDPRTFEKVVFKNPIDVSLEKDFPELGSTKTISKGLETAWTKFPRIFALSKMGWLGFKRNKFVPIEYITRTCSLRLDKIERYRYYPIKITLKNKIINEENINIISINDVNSVLLITIGEGDKAAGVIVSKVNDLFIFPDGVVGALVTLIRPNISYGYPFGNCAKSSSNTWQLLRFENDAIQKIPLFTFSNCYSLYEQFELDPAVSIIGKPWRLHLIEDSSKREFKWLMPGKKILFQFSDPPFALQWSDSGNKLIVIAPSGKMKKEIYIPSPEEGSIFISIDSGTYYFIRTKISWGKYKRDKTIDLGNKYGLIIKLNNDNIEREKLEVDSDGENIKIKQYKKGEFPNEWNNEDYKKITDW